MGAVLLALLATLGLAAAQSFAADDQPTVGLLYHTSENHSLTYTCKRDQPARLSCDFVQITGRKKAEPSELGASIKALRDEAKRSPPKEEDCVPYRQTLAVLQGKETAEVPDFAAKLKAMPEKQRNDLVAILEAMSSYCSAPTDQNIEKLATLMHSKEARTCSVASHTFTQTFRRVDGTGPWVTETQPSGPCGTVQLDRFEPERGVNGLTFWKYIARKAITNPGGELMPGMACGKLDQAEYVYDWRSRELYLNCDYIGFSPI